MTTTRITIKIARYYVIPSIFVNPFSMPLKHMKYHEEAIDDNNKDNNKNS